jgi:hypothetical protein
MKKTIFTILITALSIFSFAQDNPSNAARLLNVPQGFTKYNGQIQKKIQYEIVEYRLTDNTNVDTINGRLTRIAKVTSTFRSEPVTQSFGAYALNLCSAYLNSYGLSATSDSTMFKPSFTATATVGDFAGQTYFYGYNSVLISRTGSGYNYSVTSWPYMNTETNGLPAITPWITIKQINTTRTGTVSINQRRMTYTVSNVSETTSRPTFVRYTKDQIESRSGMTTDQIADARKVIFQIFPTSGTTHVNSLAADIVVSGNKYKGDAYINGIDSEGIPYTTLTASMGLKFPQFIQRWHLYNGVVNNSVYGSTVTITFNASELNEITVVPGTSFSYNATTKTLTYDQSKPAELWYTYECLPAQGKNEGAQIAIDLKTGVKKVL